MSRLECGDGDNPSYLLWESNVRRGMQGKRGQAFLRELRDILLAMPEKRLVKDDWITPQDDVCILGAYLRAKDPTVTPDRADHINGQFEGDEGPDRFASMFNLPRCMCWDIEYRNDNEYVVGLTPEDRYAHMLKYIEKHIQDTVTT